MPARRQADDPILMMVHDRQAERCRPRRVLSAGTERDDAARRALESRRWRSRGWFALSLVPLLFSWACIGHPPAVSTAPQSSAVGAYARLDPHQATPEDAMTFARSENTVRLSGVINGTSAFQWELAATAGQVIGLEIAVEELRGDGVKIPREAIRIYRQQPQTVERFPNWYLRSQGLRQNREFLDILVPIDAPLQGQPFNLSRNERLALWVEINVPVDARPGRYTGAVSASDSAGHVLRLPIELTVRDVYLSPRDLLPVLARVQLGPLLAAHTMLDPRNIRLAAQSEDARRLWRRVFLMLHQHGLSPYTDELYPLFTQAPDGSVVFDWLEYDGFCGPLIDGTGYDDARAAFAWPLPADLAQPDPYQYMGIDSTVYAALLREYLTQVRAHFEERGWWSRAFVDFDWPRAERGDNPQPADLAQLRRLARLAHEVDGRLAFVSKLIPQPLAGFGWFEHHYEDLSSEVDIWSTPARYQHPPTLKHLQTLGKRTWLPPDRPPFSGSLAVEAPLVQARSLPWQAYLQGHEAILLRETTNWPAGTWLLYPGRSYGLSEPVPSLRLKQLQLGLQDYQLLRILGEYGRSETARLIAGSLIKAAGTDAYGDNYQDGLFGRRVDEPEMWQLARELLINEAAEALLEDPAVVPNRPEVQSLWVKFLSGTRRVRSWMEAARLSVDDRPDRSGYLVKFDVAVRSELRLPVSGELTFDTLAPTVQRLSDHVRLGPIEEMGMARGRLVAAMPALPQTDLDGHCAQRIVFNGGTAGTASTDAVLSIVQAPVAPRPIVVDGHLADWPPNDANIAGDFRLLNGGGTVNREGGEAERERPRAESQTVVYFCRYGETLYIGLQAAVPAERRGVEDITPLRNYVEYEDLMPVGEDLVEILIDPTNLATESGDLFHLVLKSTGNPIFERGVGTSPPIGRVQPWPGPPPACSVARTEFGWSAEIAIPLATFGDKARNCPVWGLNIARLEPTRGEYSDWARSPRYCYDPRTLGNLVWR